MRKYLLVSFLLIINCSIGSESTEEIEIEDEDQNIEENSSNKTLEYPPDFDIYELFECLSDKNINQIPEPKFQDSAIIIEFDDGYSADYIEEFANASSSCESEFRNSNSVSSENEVSDSSSNSNYEINTENECKKGFYSQRPNPVKEDDSFFYYKFYWQGSQKICYNFYEPEIIDDEWEVRVKNLIDNLGEKLGIHTPINLALVDQVRASTETLNQINIDDCKIYNFITDDNEIQNCAQNADDWGNRFAAAGVDWYGLPNGGNIALFVDNWENMGYETAIKIFVHEYFHVHQNGLVYYFEEEDLFGTPKAWLNDPEGTIFNDNPDRSYLFPNWIEEGGAEFAAPILATQFDNSIDAQKYFIESLDEARNVVQVASSNGDIVSLEDYEFAGGLYESYDNPNNGIPREFAYQYTGGQWAHLFLYSLDSSNYQKLMVTFYQNWSENESKNPGNGWKVTFEALFDMPVEEFYIMFDDFMLKDREEQLSILPSNSEFQNLTLNK